MCDVTLDHQSLPGNRNAAPACGTWLTEGRDGTMAGVDYALAQVNVGRLRAPLDSPQLAGFVAALDPVNALADAAPGFVWRLQTEDGNATAVRAFEWDQAGSAGVIMNMSVWQSPEALAAFVYSAGAPAGAAAPPGVV